MMFTSNYSGKGLETERFAGKNIRNILQALFATAVWKAKQERKEW